MIAFRRSAGGRRRLIQVKDALNGIHQNHGLARVHDAVKEMRGQFLIDRVHAQDINVALGAGEGCGGWR